MISCTSEKEADLIPNMDGVLFGDPFVLLYDDTYYAFGTHNSDNGFELYYSSDLKKWSKFSSLILKPSDAHGTKSFWAPEVIYSQQDKKFYMYYTANYYSYVAVADSPLGPFLKIGNEPLFTFNSLDATVFIDDIGNKYIYVVKADIPNSIWCAILNDDMCSIDNSSLTQCLEVSQPWEGKDINEGPFVIRYEEYYYMLYSGRGFADPNYGIGYAYSKNPFGPWEKNSHNPILQYPECEGKILEGCGHGACFYDKNNKLRISFHAHNQPGLVTPRHMYIGEINFISPFEKNLPYILSISDIKHADLSN